MAEVEQSRAVPRCPPVAERRRGPARDDRGPAGRSAGQARASPSPAEARIKVARRSPNSIRQRESNSNSMLYNETFVYQWSMRLLVAQFEIAEGYTDRVAIFEAHLSRMKELEERVNAHNRIGRVTDLAQMNAVFHRLEAEAWLARVKQGQDPWTMMYPD